MKSLLFAFCVILHIRSGDADQLVNTKTSSALYGVGQQQQQHRVFPAAQVEQYAENNNNIHNSSPNHQVGMIVAGNLSVGLHSSPAAVYPILRPAIERFQQSLQLLPDYAEEYPINPDELQLLPIESIQVQVNSSNVQLYHGVDESYEISIQPTSSSSSSSPVAAIVRAQTVFGALHGLETLAQLMEFGWIMQSQYSTTPAHPVYLIHGIPLFLSDYPAYSFRGLLIDTSRHYLPISLILDTLDVMAMNKLNILHWHMVDEQSFPYEMKSHPEIAQKGAYHPQMIYTTKSIQQIIHYAYKRGIRVIPEVDMPGHTRAIAKSHPEWMSHCPNPSSPVDPTNPQVYDFVKTVYSDLNDLFPDDMVHLGGDEVNLDCWKNSSTIMEWMKEHNMTDPVELYEYFETKLLRIVDTFEKTTIVWQEVFNLNLTISPKNTIVDVWKGFDQKTIQEAVGRNFSVILSGCWYLDHLNEKWQDMYQCDPSNFTGNGDLMIGGHASMWGEHVDGSNFASRVWPRASAAAERLWTGNVTIAQQSIEERIHRFRCRMVQLGVAAGPTAPGFCPHEVPYIRSYGGKETCNDADKREKEERRRRRSGVWDHQAQGQHQEPEYSIAKQ